MTRKRPLTPEEKLLWEQVKRSTRPLFISPVVGKAVAQDLPKVKKIANTVTDPVQSLRSSQDLRKEELKKGNYAGIDKNTAERFRKGDAVIDAKLDLHGMTSEKAHKAFVLFINKQVKAQKRRLLVITGKGSGILRSALPDWLAAPNISGNILAFDTAQQKHGGSGAYYILLKRKRTNNDQK